MDCSTQGHDNGKDLDRALLWTQLGGDILGKADGDLNGYSVAMNGKGDIVAIGSRGSTLSFGYARVYKFTRGVWTQLGSDIEAESQLDETGTSVALSLFGDVLAVGEPGYYISLREGRVRVYDFDETVGSAGDWVLREDPTSVLYGTVLDYFGASVSLSDNGDRLLVGAFDADGTQTGYARVFQHFTVWQQIGSDLLGESAGDLFGGSCSISGNGNIVACGAPQSKYSLSVIHLLSWQYPNGLLPPCR